MRLDATIRVNSCSPCVPRASAATPRCNYLDGLGTLRGSTTIAREPQPDGTILVRTARTRVPSATTTKRTEHDFLVRELARAVGLGGRDLRTASASKRARSGVTPAVRQGKARIGEHHPELGEHLDRAVRTGTYCAYVPDPGTTTAWAP